jgi:hypothetical protein
MRKSLVVVMLLLLAAAVPFESRAQSPVVRAVMFWADGCPHCHTVIDEVLPPLQSRYAGQLDVQLVEISSPATEQYFLQLEEQYQVPARMRGVPALFIGDRLPAGWTFPPCPTWPRYSPRPLPVPIVPKEALAARETWRS